MLKLNIRCTSFSADASINVTLCLHVCVIACWCALKTHLGLDGSDFRLIFSVLDNNNFLIFEIT